MNFVVVSLIYIGQQLNNIEQTQSLINEFLSRFEQLKRLENSLTMQNDSINDQFEGKLRNIMEQLQMCLNKLQSNSYSSSKCLLSDNDK